MDRAGSRASTRLAASLPASWRVFLIGALALVCLAGCTGGKPASVATVQAAPSGTPVDQALFGTHAVDLASDGSASAGAASGSSVSGGSASEGSTSDGSVSAGSASGAQSLPAQAGAIRLWDSGVSWRQLEPEPGEVDWALLERAVARAESVGAQEIVWVHGTPPSWAAQHPKSPGTYGPGSSSPPKVEPYLRILGEIATRFRGRITAYQVWNEANTKLLFSGTPAQMADLTARARTVLRGADPDAILVGASTTVRRSGPVRPWYGRYAAALADLGWPVDAMSVHLYPIADQGAGTRASYIRTIRPWLAERGWTGPLWDTAVNYGDRRTFAPLIVEVPQARAAAWVARTYIDSLALGVDRVFWYAWDDHVLGIDQIDPQTGAVLPAGQAYLTVQTWFADAWWQGCSGELMAPTGEVGALTSCLVRYDSGRRARILFSHGGATSIAMPTDALQVCRLDGSCTSATGDLLPVGTAPVLLRLAL